MRSSTQDVLVAITVAVFSFLLVVGVIGIISAVSALILMLAWNAFIPPVFHGPEIGFIHAFALTFLIGSIKGLMSVNVGKKS